MCERREEAVPVAGGGEAAEVKQHIRYGILFIAKADAGPAGDSRNGREGLSPEELGRRQEIEISSLWELVEWRHFIKSWTLFCIYVLS